MDSIQFPVQLKVSSGLNPSLDSKNSRPGTKSAITAVPPNRSATETFPSMLSV